MTNIIGFSRPNLQLHTEHQARTHGMEKAPSTANVADKLALSEEATSRLQGLPAVDAPELHSLDDAMKMARNTVQMMLERPEQARVSHVPELGARVAGLVA